MLQSGPLPLPPAIRVEVVRERDPHAAGFIKLRHVELRNHYPDGSRSTPYAYFMVERHLLDAVAIVLYRHTVRGPEVILRSQLRPPLAFRGEYAVPMPAEGTGAVQWEVPAGLVEADERGEAGLFARAAAEVLEEVGLTLAPERFARLGPPTSISPGLIAEKLHYVWAEVRPDDPYAPPSGDGHVVEEHSVSQYVPLPEALKAVADERVHDLKTELALFRLATRLGAG